MSSSKPTSGNRDVGFVIWLTGLPGSGKTTIANALADELRFRGYKVEVLDGDWARKTINIDADFTRESRRIHLLRMAWIARLLARNGVIVICSFVSPYRDVRREIKEIIQEDVRYIEVYVKCSIEECIKRDPKGLYKKALRGEIKHMTGIDDPYEPPNRPNITLDSEYNSPEENVNLILSYLIRNRLIK